MEVYFPIVLCCSLVKRASRLDNHAILGEVLFPFSTTMTIFLDIVKKPGLLAMHVH